MRYIPGVQVDSVNRFCSFSGRRSVFSLVDVDSVEVSAPIKMIGFGTVNPQVRVREQRKCGCTNSESCNSL